MFWGSTRQHLAGIGFRLRFSGMSATVDARFRCTYVMNLRSKLESPEATFILFFVCDDGDDSTFLLHVSLPLPAIVAPNPLLMCERSEISPCNSGCTGAPSQEDRGG